MAQTKVAPSVFHQLLAFTVPLILTGLLQQLYSITDSLILGNFVGQSALTAVGSASSLLNVFCLSLQAWSSDVPLWFLMLLVPVIIRK